MKPQKYTEIAFGWAKRYIDEKIRKSINDINPETKAGLPKGGNYILNSYGYPMITKKSKYYVPAVADACRAQGSTIIPGETPTFVVGWGNEAGKSVLMEERKVKGGALVKSAAKELGHANCISYDKKRDVFYVCKYKYDGNNFTGDVSIVDRTNFGIIESIDIKPFSDITGSNIGVDGACYDAINDKLVVTTCDSGHNKMELIVINPDTKSMEQKYDIFPNGTWVKASGYTYQGIQMAHNGYAYFMDSTHRCLNVMDYITKIPICIINIEDFDDYGRRVMELEGMAPMNPDDPNTDIAVFHGGYSVARGWYCNCGFGIVNPFIGNTRARRSHYLGDGETGNTAQDCYVNPNGTNTIQNGTENAPYIDPNLLLQTMMNKPQRIVRNLIHFKPGAYGVLRIDDVCMRIKADEKDASGKGVEISEFDIYDSTIHLLGGTVSNLNAFVSDIWLNGVKSPNTDINSSELKVIKEVAGSSYDGHGNSFITKYTGTTNSDRFITS